MSWAPRLRTRLFLSYALVIGVGALTMFVVGTVVTRRVYSHELGGLRLGVGRGRDHEVSAAELETALDESLIPALLAGAGAALLAAAAVAWLIGSRLLRPVDEIRTATRRLAAGDYATSVPVPSEPELASLAQDVNALGAHLAGTEQRRTQLLGEVTHELRTPLTVIRGRVEALLDGVEEPSEAVFASLATEAARVQRLVDDLTMLSQADEGSLNVQMRPVDLVDVTGRVVEHLRPQFEHRGVGLTVVPGPPLVVNGDDDRLSQVVTNLVGNALSHTPAGGTVTVRSGSTGGQSWVEVVDTGRGIPADQLERIFERFYRYPQEGGHAGRGIGLTIARNLARLHGGDVTASSPGLGQGATFRLTLP